jgi:subtilisin family serine protease
MKFCLFLLFMLSFSVSNIYSQESKMSMELTRISSAKTHASKNLSLLIEGNPAEVQKAVESSGGVYRYHIGLISSVSVKPGILAELASSPFISRIEEGSIRLHPLNDTMVYLNHVVEVHNGLAPLPRSYDGSGIVCGFIDTGIDFTHGDFKDSLGKSRIKYIWDQNFPVASNTPQPFNYGQEWTNLQIDSGKCAHTDTIYWGHGTRVAGTAAGNGRAVNRYGGVATKADIIMVAVNFNHGGPTIADAAVYIFAKAKALGKPCVINCSLGSEMGSHDATDLESVIIDSLLNQQAGRVFCAATGNSGNIAYHMTSTLAGDTSFTWMRFNANDTSNGTTTMDVQIYGDSSSMKGLTFSIGADRVSPSFAYEGRTSFRSIPSQVGMLVNDSIRANGKRIALIQSFEKKTGNTYSIEYQITPDSTYYNFRIISAGTGKFDAWCFDFVQTGLPSPSAYPAISKYQLPDYDKTMETGFQCSPHVISVANYVNKNCFTDVVDSLVCDTQAIFRPRRLAPSSGHGPTRTGLQKPDIAATGDYVFSCLVLSMKQYFYNNQLAKGGMHIAGGGTSQASPVISGISALLLQQNPALTHLQVKNAITCAAYQDVYTGSSLPDNKWGYGKADAYHTLTTCAPLGVLPSAPVTGNLSVFPNPFDVSATVSFEETHGVTEIRVCDILGREITRLRVPEGTKSLTLSRSNLVNGIYFLTLEQEGKMSQTMKIAVE